MTRKDYEAIAQAIKGERDVSLEPASEYIAGWIEALDAIARACAALMAADNPAFDRARFLKACGVAS